MTLTPHREKELKHDEVKLEEIYSDIISEFSFTEIKEIAKQYAEHIMKSEINKVLEGVENTVNTLEVKTVGSYQFGDKVMDFVQELVGEIKKKIIDSIKQ